MKKLTGLLLILCLTACSGVAFASLEDTKGSIQSIYGDYRMVFDTHSQLWTKADWDEKGHKKATALSYAYSFERKGLRISMDVLYEGDKPDSLVRIQRFTPDADIKVKEFKEYFPEIYSLLSSPQAKPFAASQKVTKYFQDMRSPVTLGVVVKDFLPKGKKTYFTLISFSIMDEGRTISDWRNIDQDTYIKEVVIERITEVDVLRNMGKSNSDWKEITNFFTQK